MSLFAGSFLLWPIVCPAEKVALSTAENRIQTTVPSLDIGDVSDILTASGSSTSQRYLYQPAVALPASGSSTSQRYLYQPAVSLPASGILW